MALSNELEKGIRSEHLKNSSPSPAPARPHGPAAEPSSLAARDAGSYLNHGSKVNGKLAFEAHARIDGLVEGDIVAEGGLVIGESAVITAQIKAASIIVAGTVKGEMFAVQRIEIGPSANVLGNVTTSRLVVHEGAMFEGHCSMPTQVAQDDHKVTVLPKETVLPKSAR
jgi:cytoskeletal protein CcmA (bactofilin family)